MLMSMMVLAEAKAFGHHFSNTSPTCMGPERSEQGTEGRLTDD